MVESIISIASDADDLVLLINPANFPEFTIEAIILPMLMERLEQLTESVESYSVILLASVAINQPSTAILISNYLGLDKGVRKKLSKLWIVGGGWKITVSLMVCKVLRADAEEID